MARVTTVVTGVAGSPYYLRAYFEGTGGTQDQMIQAWHRFCVGAPEDNGFALPVNAIAVTEGFVPLVDPTNGEITGYLTGESEQTNGTNTGQRLPPANQALVHWRTGVYVSGRELRGRTNLPCQLEDGSAPDGQLSAAYRIAYGDRADALINDANVSLVVWSKSRGQWQPVIAADVWNQYSVLTSRRD